MPETPLILSTLTFLPLLGAFVLMCLPRPNDLPEHGHDDGHHGNAPVKEPFDANRQLINGVAFVFVLVNLLLSVLLFANFDSSLFNVPGRNMQFTEKIDWISIGGAHIQYHMGIDGVSLLLILLTTFLMTLCVVFSFNTKTRLKEFMVFLLMLETGMLGVFCALDLVLFYFFWEAMLIPMYFLIGIFGHENRVYAAIKFFLFTFAGSVLMLVAIVVVYNAAGTFDVVQLSNNQSVAAIKLHHMDPQALLWLFGAFSLAFMIKVPMFPFHTWLPDAHVEAPTAGSVILAGVMLKMGTYGFIRFCLPMFPEQAQYLAPIFITLAIIGIVYGSIVAAVQPDAKKLVAYTSVAHLGFVILGIFTFTRVGMMGALVQNINHGISTPMLFFIVGMLYERRHTRQISEFGGLKKVVPMLAAMLLIATLASVAVPFFNGFVGEFPILQGAWISNGAGVWPTAIAATGMILSAVYMLWWFQRLMLGPITSGKNRNLPDLSLNEWVVLTPLVVIVFWFGLSSGFWTHRMESTVSLLVSPQTETLSDEYPISASTLQERLHNERLITQTGHMQFESTTTTMVERPSMEPVLYKDIPPPPKWNGIPAGSTGSTPLNRGGGDRGSPAGGRPRTRPHKMGAANTAPIKVRLEGVR